MTKTKLFPYILFVSLFILGEISCGNKSQGVSYVDSVANDSDTIIISNSEPVVSDTLEDISEEADSTNYEMSLSGKEKKSEEEEILSVCPMCLGTGKLPHTDNQCTRCHGSGLITIVDNGKGGAEQKGADPVMIVCPHCNGTTHEPGTDSYCTTCGGTGTLTYY